MKLYNKGNAALIVGNLYVRQGQYTEVEDTVAERLLKEYPKVVISAVDAKSYAEKVQESNEALVKLAAEKDAEIAKLRAQVSGLEILASKKKPGRPANAVEVSQD